MERTTPQHGHLGTFHLKKREVMERTMKAVPNNAVASKKNMDK